MSTFGEWLEEERLFEGLMQEVPLTLGMVRERMAALHTAKRVVTRYPHGVTVARYGDVLERAAQLANFLRRTGLGEGDRVATLAWNSQPHLELYLAVPCMGAVLHTINARLNGAAIAELLSHAGDKVLFVDRSLLPSLCDAKLPKELRCVVVMDDTGESVALETSLHGIPLHEYESALRGESRSFAWPQLDERTASGICYTSGTTGTPKGVVYSHRSAALHTFSCLFADGIAMRERDVCMPVVPMFHANAWGFPYAAMFAGASLALPSRETGPENLVELIERAGVTMATAVPTVWLNLLEALDAGRIDPARLATLKRLPVGGAAVSEALIAGYERYGIAVMHCWGMTEISPLGLNNFRKSTLDDEVAKRARSAQGLPIPGCKLRIVGEDGKPAPHDGESVGELQISSPWTAAAYYDPSQPDGRRAPAESFSQDGDILWLRTGDVATIDADGYVRLVDRAKDMIKSGGEWISSQALEVALMNHPDVSEAAVVAKPDPKWQERPVAFVIARPGAAPSAAGLREHLAKLFPKWQLPDEIGFVAELPRGRTGKVDKIALRARAAERL